MVCRPQCVAIEKRFGDLGVNFVRPFVEAGFVAVLPELRVGESNEALTGFRGRIAIGSTWDTDLTVHVCMLLCCTVCNCLDRNAFCYC